MYAIKKPTANQPSAFSYAWQQTLGVWQRNLR